MLPAVPRQLASGQTTQDCSLWSTPGFRSLWLSGLCWHWGRWAIAFLAAYHVNVVTDSPRMVQLTGAVMWAPLLFGGAIGGVISDRFNRVRTVQMQVVVLMPLVVLIGIAERDGWLRLPLLFGLLVVTGFGWVTDMTSRRAHMFEIVGHELLHKAMALESVALASGIAVGNLAGGAIADTLGVGAAFYVVAGLLGASLVLLAMVSRVPVGQGADEVAGEAAGEAASSATGQAASQPSTLRLLREGLRLAKTNANLRSILGVTVIMNFFFFAYFPAVQRIGDALDASPTQIGLISSMTGFGMITGSLLTAWLLGGRWGWAYVGGVGGGMITIIPFALSPTVAFAVVALWVASCGSGFFGATQSTLVMTSVGADMRGRAMGLLSMAIGALPLGMYSLGEVATALGTRTALVIFNLTGLAVLITWVAVFPQVLSRRGPQDAAT